METAGLIEIIARDEDSKHQFKANVTNAQSLSEELVAFSNSGGGQIFIGVSNDGTFSSLKREDMGRLNHLVDNTCTNNVRPPINVETENISAPDGLVMVISIPDGISKPYVDNNGVIWGKNGADKRKVTAREEIQRLFQKAGLIHGDEIPVRGLTVADLDVDFFHSFLKQKFGDVVKTPDLPLPVLLENMNLLREGLLNVSGALLFARNPSYRLPAFIIKAIAYPGTDIDDKNYIDSQDINGKLTDLFQKSMSFVLGNIRHIQGDKGMNTTGSPEIPKIVFEELIANALIHRDYFITAPVRIFVYSDRIEIISPGHLPNNLTVKNIKSGNSNIRNPILASYATKAFPYRGLGTGIIRSLKAYPDIKFENNTEANLFKAIIGRRIIVNIWKNGK